MSSALQPPARRTGLWATGIVACAVLLIAGYEYFVRTSSGQLLDTVTRLAASHFEHPLPFLNPDNPWIAFYIAAPPAVLLAVITLARQKYVSALIAVGMVIASNLSTQLFKSALPEREDFGEFPSAWTQSYLDNSLPSGHTTIAASAAVAVFLVASPRQRPFLGVLAAFWSAGWGGYIFIEAWHRPSDMLAAYLVVALWSLVAGWLIMRCSPKENTVLAGEEPVAAVAAGFSWFLGIVLTAAGAICYLFAGGWAGIAEAMEDPTLWLWLAGVLVTGGPAFLCAGAGINFFAAEAGRRQRGTPLPHPQGERIAYPIPQNLTHLYKV